MRVNEQSLSITQKQGYQVYIAGSEEPVPEARRKLLVTDLCVDCATIEEKRNRI